MEPAMQSPHRSETNHNETLQIDFTWAKMKSYISNVSDPSKPLYIVDYSSIKKECILVSSASTGLRIGSGVLHIFSINPNFKLHGRKGVLKALSRWKTSYTHQSYAFAASPDGPPATMTWTGHSDFKTWDFVCLDQRQMPVAKVRANWWAVHKVGRIEFLGDRVISEAARDEIVVTGLTIMYCMVIRSISLPALVGAVVARPGPIKDGSKQQLQQQDGPAAPKDQALAGKQD
ncbi:MAG: hypothetical protein Q9198_003413 [Flavoplaca austrocitrina]